MKIIIIVILSLSILCIALWVISTLIKFKRFKKNPVGWKVKYWIASEDYVGKVLSVNKNFIIISTIKGDVSFDIEDVVPL